MANIIYNPPRIETPLGITIYNAGLTMRKAEPYARVSSWYNLCHYQRGKGTHSRAGAQALWYGPGTVAVAEPGILYERRPLNGELIDAQWINFGGPKIDEIFFRYNTGASHLFFAGADHEYLRYFTKILAALKEGTAGDILRSYALLLLLVVETLHKKKATRNSTAPDAVNAFTLFCKNRRSETHLLINDFLSRHRLSYESFRKKFKRDTGISPRDYWLMEKLSEAKRLLVTSSLSVVAISEKVGIDPPAYFSRLFKKKEGVTPTEYRAQDSV